MDDRNVREEMETQTRCSIGCFQQLRAIGPVRDIEMAIDYMGGYC